MTKKIAQLERIRYFLQKELFDKTEANIFIAGGFITKKLIGEEVNDIDIFFPSRKELALFLRDARNNLGFKPFYRGKNLIKGNMNWQGKKIKVDLVKRIDSRPSLNIEAKFSTFEELQEFVETVRNDPVRKKQKEIILKYFGEGK